MVTEVMPDDGLMKALEGERKGRRDDYPIRAVWNSILAELPVGYRVTKASRHDIEELLPMVEEAKQKHFQSIETLAGDKAYDGGSELEKLYDTHGIKPVIDIRNLWKDGEQTRALAADEIDNVVYDHRGTVYCHCPDSNERYEMAFCGFEKDRKALKYKCPAAAYGIECKGYSQCSQETKGKIVRIRLEVDRRIFVPIARSSYKWQRIYNGRTAVERVNSRIDLSFGFERHFIRGRAKMTLRAGLVLIVMLSMALARIKRDQMEDMRSLVKQAA